MLPPKNLDHEIARLPFHTGLISGTLAIVELDGKSELKRAIRLQLKAILALNSAHERETAASAIADQLPRKVAWREATTILFYSALKSEINLSELIKKGISEGKTIALPRWDAVTQSYCAAQLDPANALEQGSFGVLEPSPEASVIPWNHLDLALVPGVAFDLRGMRLGRGKGFYDRMLAQVYGTKCGVAFDAQVMKQLPAESHDIRMDCLITPTCWIEFPRDGT